MLPQLFNKIKFHHLDEVVECVVLRIEDNTMILAITDGYGCIDLGYEGIYHINVHIDKLKCENGVWQGEYHG